MPDVLIEIREDGPYKITGPVTVHDPDGNPIEIPAGKTSIFLCRCGHSTEKPFCDGTHREIGWCATAEVG